MNNFQNFFRKKSFDLKKLKNCYFLHILYILFNFRARRGVRTCTNRCELFKIMSHTFFLSKATPNWFLASPKCDFFFKFFSRKLRVRAKLRVAYILVVKSVAYILVANSKLRTAYNLVVKSKLRVAYILVAKSRLRVVYISVVESELVATYNKVMRLKLRVVYIMEVKLP